MAPDFYWWLPNEPCSHGRVVGRCDECFRSLTESGQRYVEKCEEARDLQLMRTGPVLTRASSGSAPRREWKGERKFKTREAVDEPLPVLTPAEREDVRAELVEHLNCDGQPSKKAAAAIEAYLNAATTRQRTEAFLTLDDIRIAASDGRHSIKWDYNDEAPFGYYGAGKKHREHAFSGYASYTRTLTGKPGRRADAEANDVEAATAFLREWAKEPLAILAAPMKRGRKSPAETARLHRLDEAVAATRAAGFTQEAVGQAVGRGKRWVSHREILNRT